jgi:hypothetical protein
MADTTIDGPIEPPTTAIVDGAGDTPPGPTVGSSTERSDPPAEVGGRTYHLEIFLMAFASLLLEVAYTRVISFKLYYYYTFLVIGLALLGIGCGGVMVAISKRLRAATTDAIIMWGLIVAAASVIVGYVAVAITPIDSLALWDYGTAASLRNLGWLIVVCVSLFASFVSIGVMLAALFGRRTANIGRLYFADLVGAGLACGVVVFALYWVGPPVTILAAGLIMALAGIRMAFTPPRRREASTPPGRALAKAPAVAGVVVAAALVAMLAVPGLTPSIRVDDTKNIAASEPDSELFSGWGAIFRVDAYDFGDQYFLMHDGMLGSAIHRWDGDPASLTRFDDDPRLFAFTADGAPRDDVLIVGAAGGNEVLASVYFGADRIDAVELNPITHSLVVDRFADYAGRVAEYPGVNYVQGDGRTFLSRTDQQYDLIWYPAPDSYSATNAAASGAFVLSESYLYTSQTIIESLEHLRDSGVVVAQFGELDYERKPNRTSRYVATARKALTDLGVTDPGSHIVVLRSTASEVATYSTVLVKKTPFTPGEVADLTAAAAVVPGSEVRWAPGTDVGLDGATIDAPAVIASSSDTELADFLSSYPYEVGAITDDGPFFWHFAPFSTVLSQYASPIDATDLVDLEDAVGERVLILLLAVAVLMGAVFLLLPFVTIRDTWRQLPRKGTSLLYFGALGLGFMFFEISLIQRLVLFLGFPTYSLTVTLASILIFTGVGALISGRFAGRPRTVLAPLAAILVVLTGFYLWGLPLITEGLLGWPLGARVAVAFLVLAPLGLTLGMFMPLGLGAVSALSPFGREYVAWGWAINGFASITGAVLTTLLAMVFGFTVVLVIALGVYGVALLALRALTAGSRRPVPAS